MCWANVLPLGYSHNTEVTYLLIIHIVFVRTKDTGKGQRQSEKELTAMLDTQRVLSKVELLLSSS